MPGLATRTQGHAERIQVVVCSPTPEAESQAFARLRTEEASLEHDSNNGTCLLRSIATTSHKSGICQQLRLKLTSPGVANPFPASEDTA